MYKIGEKLQEVKIRLDHLERIRGIFAENDQQLKKLQKDQSNIVWWKKEFSEQRARLGVFAGKKKKHLDQTLSNLSQMGSDLAGKSHKSKEVSDVTST